MYITAPIIILAVFLIAGFTVQILACTKSKGKSRLVPLFITGGAFSLFSVSGIVCVAVESVLEAVAKDYNHAAGIIGTLILGFGMLPTAAFVGDCLAWLFYAIVKCFKRL